MSASHEAGAHNGIGGGGGGGAGGSGLSVAVAGPSSHATTTSNSTPGVKSMLVTLVRHGESQDNLKSIWAGWRDAPLSTNGQAQAKAVGKAFANVPIAAIYSSDLKRAASTADEILQVRCLRAVIDC